ncbi:uncharacterized protein BP5553_03838 [Venustampulla echinocandica]|uniref:Uncharacterized protein n=1 Tax=Venustampulla echinocandica TaxID=2656787 RepID=A0A370TVK1_9HELO|nr:uncharacterized protein BP5553_03838 [Venustampulla echinocandica]RDL39498.1 hypothetical protein BP5553_03838 [Venustampulla echinocandica]
MADKANAERGVYITASYRLNQIFERYGREPNINELRAIEELPLGKEKDLWDTSANGRRIYYLLKTSEETSDVSLLDEAGKLLWEQIFRPHYSEADQLGQQEVNSSSDVPYVDLECQTPETHGYSAIENGSFGNHVGVQSRKEKMQKKLAVGQEEVGFTHLQTEFSSNPQVNK